MTAIEIKRAAMGAAATALAAAVLAMAGCGAGGSGQAAGDAAVQAAAGLSASDVKGIEKVAELEKGGYLDAVLEALGSAAAGDTDLEVALYESGKVYVTGSEHSYEVDYGDGDASAKVLEHEVAGVNEGEFTTREDKLEENLRKAEREVAEESARDEQREEAAKKASTAAALSDAAGLERLGLPAKAAASLHGEASAWCEKKGAEPPSVVRAEDVSTEGATTSVALHATKAINGGEVAYEATGTWSKGKWALAEAK